MQEVRARPPPKRRLNKTVWTQPRANVFKPTKLVVYTDHRRIAANTDAKLELYRIQVVGLWVAPSSVTRRAEADSRKQKSTLPGPLPSQRHAASCRVLHSASRKKEMAHRNPDMRMVGYEGLRRSIFYTSESHQSKLLDSWQQGGRKKRKKGAETHLAAVLPTVVSQPELNFEALFDCVPAPGDQELLQAHSCAEPERQQELDTKVAGTRYRFGESLHQGALRRSEKDGDRFTIRMVESSEI
ncbi:hypothetical protein DFH06DRAFT_1150109 [Mycena polygramma]|nr:hypothetical protein DFH06DRAFT_1150109 [Mycena polygramma]